MQDSLSVMQVKTHEHQRVDEQVHVEHNVHDDVGKHVGVVRQNVVDGVWQDEEKVADEHCQHGPRRLVHHLLARRRRVWRGGQAVFVASYLYNVNYINMNI